MGREGHGDRKGFQTSAARVGSRTHPCDSSALPALVTPMSSSPSPALVPRHPEAAVGALGVMCVTLHWGGCRTVAEHIGTHRAHGES